MFPSRTPGWKLNVRWIVANFSDAGKLHSGRRRAAWSDRRGHFALAISAATDSSDLMRCSWSTSAATCENIRIVMASWAASMGESSPSDTPCTMVPSAPSASDASLILGSGKATGACLARGSRRSRHRRSMSRSPQAPSLLLGPFKPIRATFVVCAVVVDAGNGRGEVNRFSHWKFAEIDGRQIHVKTKFAEVPIAENILISDYTYRADWNIVQDDVGKSSLSRKELRSRPNKRYREIGLILDSFEIGIVYRTNCDASVEFQPPRLAVSHVPDYSSNEPCSRSDSFVRGRRALYGGYIRNQFDRVRNYDSSIRDAFSVARNVQLKARETCRGEASYGRHERKESYRPVFFFGFVVGLASYCTGFWLPPFGRNETGHRF